MRLAWGRAPSPTLEQAEIARARHKPTESLDAYDVYLRGMASVYRWTKEGVSEALRLFGKAIESDSSLAAAYGMAAWCYVWRRMHGWMNEPDKEIAEAHRLALNAVELGTGDAVALTFGGIALGMMTSDVEAAIVHIDRALVLNPNFTAAWTGSGIARTHVGDSETAIEHLHRAMRLRPDRSVNVHDAHVLGLRPLRRRQP